MNTTTVTLASLNARDAMIEVVYDNKDVYRAPVLPEVAKFAIEMETVLRENDYNSGWDTMSIHKLFNHIKDEFEELQREYTLQTNALDGVNRRYRMRKEAIDIANFCMFLSYWTHKED